MTDGLLVVDKPTGLTSHDVVARVRRLAGTRRVGHAGTLDPMATGVLVLGLGRGTRLLGHLALTDKAYTATIRLGVSTVTDDAAGDVLDRRDAQGLDEAAVRTAARRLVGVIEQVPSAVSAVKVDGRRAYARVRAGEEVALAARRIEVTRFELGPLRRADQVVDVDVDVECSTGTYVRALARDLGAALGVGGHLTSLRRTRVGPYGIELARTLEALAPDLAPIPLGSAAAAAFPSVRVRGRDAERLRHGLRVDATGHGDAVVAALDEDGDLLALLCDSGDTARPVAVFAG